MNSEDVKSKIINKGHWRVIIRTPKSNFEKDRFMVEDLNKSIEEAQVHLGSWPYPYNDEQDIEFSNVNKIRKVINWEGKIEFWEYVTSGQFGHIFAIPEDHLVAPDSEVANIIRSRLRFGQDKVKDIDKFIDVTSVIFQFTKIYQFAVNLAQQKEYKNVSEFEIIIELIGVKDRMLYIGSPRRGDLISPYICRYDSDKITHNNIYNTEDLIGRYEDKACEAILKTFISFGWLDVQERMIKEDQRKLLERRI